MIETLKSDLSRCTLCADRFAATQSAHRPNPVVWFDPRARILIASQAPGMRAHLGTRPFIDPSGDRLRDWLAVGHEQFYDQSRVAIVPMAFCFPGYDTTKADLPPPKICAQTWRADVLGQLPNIRLTLLVGGYSQKYHLGTRGTVTDTVAAWRDHAPEVFPLPHPSWRNTAWIKRNPWFEAELLPSLRTHVQEAMT